MKEYIYEGLYIPHNYPKILCWTPHGTIDTGKSIKIVLKDDRISIIRRYKLASVYCLEDDIRELWTKMSPACRKLFYDKNSKVLQNDLAVYWTYYIDGKIDLFEHRIQGSVNKYGLELAFIQGSKPAALYFLQKLNDAERYELFEKYFEYFGPVYAHALNARSEHYADLIYGLLIRMDEKQRLRVFELHAYIIFVYFVEYPFDQLLEMTLNEAKYCISDECKNALILKILSL
ncbi:uncharacterized protein TNIN_80841 [Trichonephila inaurata madagascariensis]|uniref:Uncharacterized protein n=1 Tax=Trichonephila inaurata madagascariensis TaxID=2747483 RepID=A0A8X6X6K8_9ARAC|nr:uncharacterized protein TNIN_80841 [Trichonephila inaurata madagascariensis]